jgi:hypothetical protein
MVCFYTLCACSHNTHYIGEKYLNAKYVNNPLGENQVPDSDPLIRFDAFDCTTFVETSLADGDIKKLNKIRYKDGTIDFINRNHFIETDWLSNNNNIVENVSNLYGKTALHNVVINKKNWFKRNYNINTNFEPQQSSIEYIPYKNLSKINIQKPLIVLFISDGTGFYEKIGTDLAVVHMGFLLPGNILRHASQKYGYVMDTDFTKYAFEQQKNKHNIGIALVKIK